MMVVSQHYKTVALLPMKANSERVKGKNFLLFNGRPLFYWILDTLLAIDEVEKIVINTDARSLLMQHSICKNSKILIRDRPAALCGELTSMNHILADDIKNVAADLYLMTHTTNPLLSPRQIQEALTTFNMAQLEKRADSLFTVNRMQTRFYRPDGTPVNHKVGELKRTQDLEPLLEENSNLYIFTRESFASTGARIGRQPILLESRKLESFDIDDQDSWDMADTAFRYLKEKKFYRESH